MPPQGSGPAAALTMQQSCANAPGTKGIRFCGSAEQWIGGVSMWLMWQSYNHFGTPNQINCTNTAIRRTLRVRRRSGYYVTPLGSAPPAAITPVA